MMITNRGIVTDTIAVKNQELNPDELHYYQLDALSIDQNVIRYDVGKMVQEWGVNMWFSTSPAGPVIGRYLPVTYQTDINLKVVGTSLTIEKGGGYIDTLFEIVDGITYYINIHNQQSNDNFYWLIIGEEETPSDICA